VGGAGKGSASAQAGKQQAGRTRQQLCPGISIKPKGHLACSPANCQLLQLTLQHPKRRPPPRHPL
jgi:hypothetical protein